MKCEKKASENCETVLSVRRNSGFRRFMNLIAKSVREILAGLFFVKRKNALILARLFSMLRKANEAIGVRQCYLHGEHRLPMFNTAERGKNPPKVIFCTPYS